MESNILIPYLVNTSLFQDEANAFRRSGKDRSYCPHPVGSFQYESYWLEQDRRCKEGYKVGDLWIPGTYYFYLNFTQCDVRDEVSNRRRKDFPRFTDVDLEYFLIMERARKERKGVILVKPRRTGFSYKNAGLISHEYNFHRDSKCIIGAFDSKFSDNTMSMVLNNLNFLNAHTPWGKERNPDTRTHVVSRYQETNDNGLVIWKGYNSEVKSLTFKDNPFASIGLSSNLFLFEEAGKFPNITQSYNISEPCWKDGDDLIGLPILYGTGGDMEGGTIEFNEMYYEPEKYNLLAFENIWDLNPPTKYCGWFIPAYRMRFGTYKDVSKVYPEDHGKPLVDEDGNSNEKLARQSILDDRKLKEQGSDQQAKRDTITQYPLTPQEAFLTKASIYFPVRELQATKAKLNTPEELAKHNVGMLEWVDNEVKWNDIQGAIPYREYPIKTKEEGYIEMFELPRREISKIDRGRYIIGVDHYAKDEATTDSMGCAMVFDRLTRRVVAEYTGRPYNTDRFYEICRRLAVYYDAKIMYENNITNMFHYFEKKKALSLLEDTPMNMRDRNTWMEGKNTSKGIVASQPTNQKAREIIKSWLLEPVSESSERLNLEDIRSVGLLEELIKWDPDHNYDRISAMGMVMLFDATLTLYQSEEIKQRNKNLKLGDFFKRFKRPNNTIVDPIWEQEQPG
jgi:hypothetical protein